MCEKHIQYRTRRIDTANVIHVLRFDFANDSTGRGKSTTSALIIITKQRFYDILSFRIIHNNQGK